MICNGTLFATPLNRNSAFRCTLTYLDHFFVDIIRLWDISKLKQEMIAGTYQIVDHDFGILGHATLIARTSWDAGLVGFRSWFGGFLDTANWSSDRLASGSATVATAATGNLLALGKNGVERLIEVSSHLVGFRWFGGGDELVSD